MQETNFLPDYVCMAHHQLVRLFLLLRLGAVKILPENHLMFYSIDFTDVSLFINFYLNPASILHPSTK